jgi:hypothetical protein
MPSRLGLAHPDDTLGGREGIGEGLPRKPQIGAGDGPIGELTGQFFSPASVMYNF